MIFQPPRNVDCPYWITLYDHFCLLIMVLMKRCKRIVELWWGASLAPLVRGKWNVCQELRWLPRTWKVLSNISFLWIELFGVLFFWYVPESSVCYGNGLKMTQVQLKWGPLCSLSFSVLICVSVNGSHPCFIWSSGTLHAYWKRSSVWITKIDEGRMVCKVDVVK